MSVGGLIAILVFLLAVAFVALGQMDLKAGLLIAALAFAVLFSPVKVTLPTVA